jgi:vancomycin aglycone glucosyltransferase
MRVLLSTIGSRGDVQPLVALALALRALDQDVRLCVPPDFQEWIRGLGLAVTPIGPELRTFTAAKPATSTPPAPLSPEQRRQLAEASVATQFDTIANAADGCDIIVGATALQIAARSVAEQRDITYVFVAYCPIVLPSPHHAPPPLPPIPGAPQPPATADNRELWARDGARFTDLFGAALNAHRASIGLPPVSDVRAHIFGDQPWLATDRTLGPWPESTDADVFQPGAWILEDERPLDDEVEAFLAAGEPPIYFGFGSMRAPQDLTGVMIDTVRALGRRAIVSRGWANLSLDDSDVDCLTIGEANLRSLFTRVAAVVHHGGAGTTTLAALAGAAQVVIPQIYDQHYWARRVQDLGIGTAHTPGMPTTDSLTAALRRALDADVAVQAKSIATAVSSDGARIAAQRLLTMTR